MNNSTLTIISVDGTSTTTLKITNEADAQRIADAALALVNVFQEEAKQKAALETLKTQPIPPGTRVSYMPSWGTKEKRFGITTATPIWSALGPNRVWAYWGDGTSPTHVERSRVTVEE